MSSVPVCPVGLHIHVTFSQNVHAWYLESESFFSRVKTAHRSSHSICRAQNTQHIMPVTLWPQTAWNDSFVCCSYTIHFTGSLRGMCVKFRTSFSGPCKDQCLNTQLSFFIVQNPTDVVFLAVEGFSLDHEWELSVGRRMKEATAYKRSGQVRQQTRADMQRHMQPSARPWTRSIRQHYILNYPSLDTESCWNIHGQKGNMLLPPQGILFHLLWPPDCLWKGFIGHSAF